MPRAVVKYVFRLQFFSKTGGKKPQLVCQMRHQSGDFTSPFYTNTCSGHGRDSKHILSRVSVQCYIVRDICCNNMKLVISGLIVLVWLVSDALIVLVFRV